LDSDYNYERRLSDNTCQKIEGLPDRPAESVCRENPGLIEYYPITGYRKIPLSTCSGGRELQYGGGDPLPCADHEKEYEERHRMSGTALFFAVVVPIAVAVGAGWWVYTRWDGKFGRIRLGGGPTSAGGSSAGETISTVLAWPVALAAGAVAVVAALPLLVRSLWRSAAGVFGSPAYGTRAYTSRSSFARGRGDYATVENDEGELLGDESDEEV
jgi:hypothetical protein